MDPTATFDTLTQFARDALVGKQLLGKESYTLYEADGLTPTDSRMVRREGEMEESTSMRYALGENPRARVVFYTTSVFGREEDVVHEVLSFRNMVTMDAFTASSVYSQPRSAQRRSVTAAPWVDFVVQSAAGKYTGATSVVVAYDASHACKTRVMSVYRTW